MTVAVAIAAIVSVFALFLAFLYLLARHALEEGPPMTGPSSTPRGERA
ncbi:MAG: hypothetical protein HOV68_31665, partial [Streptomycetaceae bacterium]|nr:hypothetical protein [Streptomycetaceae bacterium]